MTFVSVWLTSMAVAAGSTAAPLVQPKCARGNGASWMTARCSAHDHGNTLGFRSRRVVGEPNDAFEQEANLVAARVLDRPGLSGSTADTTTGQS
jgi:hypothetical protein